MQKVFVSEAFCYHGKMSLICITGHQGTGKSTILNQLHTLGVTAYGLDEEKVAGYFNLVTGAASQNIPQGLDRNLDWRKDNVWQVDIEKVRKLVSSSDNNPTYYIGYATNIEDLWDICDQIIILKLDDNTTRDRLKNRKNNSFGKHPGELELAILNSKQISNKANSYKKHPVYYVDAASSVEDVASHILKITSS